MQLPENGAEHWKPSLIWGCGTGWGVFQQADTGSGVVRLPWTACQESSTLSSGSCLHAIGCFDLCWACSKDASSVLGVQSSFYSHHQSSLHTVKTNNLASIWTASSSSDCLIHRSCWAERELRNRMKGEEKRWSRGLPDSANGLHHPAVGVQPWKQSFSNRETPAVLTASVNHDLAKEALWAVKGSRNYQRVVSEDSDKEHPSWALK